MNKTLFKKVKDLCKDTGLSEKYLTAITEKMGGSIEDDSTDEAEIEKEANQIADVAKKVKEKLPGGLTKRRNQRSQKNRRNPKNLKNRRSQRNLITIQTNGSPNFKRKWIK